MKKILIVEDEKSIAEIERDYLEVEGFEVVLEYDGTSGLKTAEEGCFDLVILDIMLPGVDGLEICRRLRKKTDAPILMVTAKVDSVDKVRGLGLGANDYIVKPFEPVELVARVKSHIANYDRIKGSMSQNGVRLTFGDVVILPLARRVLIKDEEVFLTAKEFDLLYLFAQNPNVAFSRDEIFNKVWGLNSNGDTHTVVVHITHLREKLPNICIETIRGIGYRFSATR